ncbi:MAG: [Fe-Fe] hydrogenase large subunit C-terminal domain-containing protein [Christensenellales bacterium]|jgi:iron only hydrogenase large subunit-like protein
MTERIHTVTLDIDKCKGCIACMQRCPTEAIRVRDGKARVLYEKCIGCGECVRICPHQAKKAVYDSLDIINNFKYKIALPAPSLFGQFNDIENLGIIIKALKNIGFDEIVEVAQGAELISEATRNMLEEDTLKKPIISTACPAVLQLILLNYHNFIDNLLPLLPPVDVMAKLAREKAEKKLEPLIKKGEMKKEDIGVFFLSPCPAKVFALKSGIGVNKPTVDGVLAISDVYFKALSAIKNAEADDDSHTGVLGLSWASSGGESAGIFRDKYLAADGVENCINILNELENGKLKDIEFIELNACPGGCVGGVLNIENPFVAKAKIRSLRKYLPITRNSMAKEKKNLEFFKWECSPELNDALKLAENFEDALKKMRQIDDILKQLPMLDCGLCGAPSCRAFALDIISGAATIAQCPRRQEK